MGAECEGEEGDLGRLSPATLDAILASACSDPALNDLLATRETHEDTPNPAEM